MLDVRTLSGSIRAVPAAGDVADVEAQIRGGREVAELPMGLTGHPLNRQV